MLFLLVAVNAKYIHSNPAVYSLKRCAGEEACHVRIAEYTTGYSRGEVLEDIYRRSPDAVGFSCYIWNWEMIQDVLTELAKLRPGLPVWLGGPEVSYDPEEILKKYPMLTGIMAGEGEATFAALLHHYVTGEGELLRIPGLVLPGGRTAPREPLAFSRLPFPYEELDSFADRIIYYESQRGCPFRCSYCLSSIDKTVRFRDVETVKRELRFFLDRRVKQVKFVDRTFNCNHEHAMEIWRYILENDNGITNFHFEIAGDILNEEEIDLLSRMRPGLVQMEIGVQSLNERTLEEICRVSDIKALRRAVAEIKKARNIHVHLDLIAGLPCEDYGSFRRSFDGVYAMGPHQLQLGFLKVLKGSAMRERAAEYGLVYTEKPPYEVLYTKWLSYEEIRRLKRVEEMVELYHNSGQFTHTLPELIKRFDGPFSMFEELALFYERNGYFVREPARSSRYRILLDFAGEADEARLPLYAELLTFDFYLRENAKSRPEFAPDLSAHKKRIREFYEREETVRELLPGYAGYDAAQISRMTHAEPFSHMFEGYAVFDYSRRDPLTHGAEVIFLDGGFKRIQGRTEEILQNGE